MEHTESAGMHLSDDALVEEVNMLGVYILCRLDASPQLPMGDCDLVDPSLFESMNDHWIYYYSTVERLFDPATSLPARGGMEKSPHFLHFIVEMCCKHSGVVVDPFMGGGRTLYACRRTRRHCIAMDSDQATLDLALKRYSLFCLSFLFVVDYENRLCCLFTDSKNM
ncbi:hypothetical protein O6H91_16G016100 [Diphasiastrum complanatum]|uniref:Uncharacterized protein n=1 Tax=Diphasiastrum complanatum TaxID=34168 RepID=A0ACC2BA64_DIPCM|nr:hypothetical protein O6H91_16G016100 [Diphasiastrum complanatum]